MVSRISDKEVFLRQKDKSVKPNRDQVLALEYDKNQRSYEKEITNGVISPLFSGCSQIEKPL